MSSTRALGAFLAALAFAALAFAAPASAVPTADWSIHSVAVPTNFVPGDTDNDYFYEVTIANSGGAVTDGSPIILKDTLPAGLVVEKVDLLVRSTSPGAEAGGVFNYGPTACSTDVVAEVSTVECEVSAALPEALEPTLLHPSEGLRMVIHIETPLSVTGPLANLASVEGGGIDPATASSGNEAGTEPAGSGFSTYDADLLEDDGSIATQAGSHPYQYTTSFAVNTRTAPAGSLAPFVPAGGDLRNISVVLPPGLIGNPTASSLCTAREFNEALSVNVGGSDVFQNGCPDGSAVGLVVVQQVEGIGQVLPVPLYNLVPPEGMPAQLGFQVAGAPIFINTKVRSGSDYGITAYLNNTSQAKRVTAAAVTIWGIPADPSHDRLRGHCLNARSDFSIGNCPAGVPAEAFLRLPTSCASPLLTEMSFNTWTDASSLASEAVGAPTPTGCDQLEFEPTISAVPQTSAADSPSGLNFNLHLPQDESAELATADLSDVTVTLPAGVTINPASAGGLEACSPQQIAIKSDGPAACPSASKVGSVLVSTPLLDHPIKGGVFLATQGQNPFGSLIAIYIAAFDQETGVVLKLAGKVEPDASTGQITTRFTNNPQIPFEDLTVEFFDGPRAPLRTPPRCGPAYTTTTAMRPYSAPASGPDATPSDSFAITQGPNGSACPTGALQATLSAGMTDAVAGSSSPFVMRLTREDGTGEISALSAVTPAGLSAKLKGVPYCAESGIAQALARSKPGDGSVELASPSCPAASRVGSASAGAGAGPFPYYASGNIYLAGPYREAPLSLVAIVPAIAGPFDLGVVATRIALRLNETTAQVTAESDPFPRILSGIPLDIRDIRVNLDRPDFTVAPTNCEPKTVATTVFGVEGGSVEATDRFQVGGCKKLRFGPKLSLSLKGGTKRGDNPAVRAILTAKPGEANIGRTVVTLPPSEQIDNAHINNPCTRVQFNAGACPRSSILGYARAFTPLLDKPLEGPVYFRSNGGERNLPDIVADLNGQIRIVLVGYIDSVNARVRTTFATVPDAPVTKFSLRLSGGKKGLLEHNRNICNHAYRASVKMNGQNGKLHDFKPLIKNSCANGKKHNKRRSDNSTKHRKP